MEKRFHTVLDKEGRPVNGASVEVRTHPGNALASIYSANNTSSPKPNPFLTDSKGYFEYYAANGRYTWIISTDLETKTITDVVHDDSVPLTGSLVWDPPSIANGAGETSPAITVTGAALGDFVQVSAPYDLAGLVATGYVSAANQCRIRLHNSTGSAVDLGSGTWRVAVRKA